MSFINFVNFYFVYKKTLALLGTKVGHTYFCLVFLMLLHLLQRLPNKKMKLTP